MPGLKRKHSASELSSTSSFSSPTRSDTMEVNAPLLRSPSLMRAAIPSHLHSRTLKRFRDSRPSDEEVHQRTLNMLFSAQQQEQHNQIAEQVVEPTPELPRQEPRQRSLHNFWSLPSAPSSASSTPSVERVIYTPTTCEDCGVGLGADAGGDAMEVDGYGAYTDHACGACGRQVCFHCSVSNLGEQRRCLQCADRKVWIRGMGWT